MATATIPFQVRLKPEVAQHFRQAAKNLGISQTKLFEKIADEFLEDLVDRLSIELTKDEEETPWEELEAELKAQV